MKFLHLGISILFATAVSAHPENRIAHVDQAQTTHQSGTASTLSFPFDLGLSAFFESRYVTEGRDNLDGGSLVSVEATAGYNGFELGTWAAESPQQDYTEYNFWISYSYEWQQFTFSIGHNVLHFASDAVTDQDTSADVTYRFGNGIEMFVGGYYSKLNEGFFYELSISREYMLADRLYATPVVTLGLNDGYIADGHDGLNHLALGVESTYELSERISLGAYLSGNVAIDSDVARYADDALLRDFVYTGVTLNFAY